MIDQYLKKWAGLPKCATNSVLHMKVALDIYTLSALYTETHCTSQAATRLKGDSLVNHALNNKIDREKSWTRKHSIAVFAENQFNEAERMNSIENVRPYFENEKWAEQKKKYQNKIKQDIQFNLRYENEKTLFNHVKNLIKQGKLLELAETEKNDITWKSYIYNLKKGTMKFIINAALDTLPTKSNLLQWGKATSDKCKQCRVRET